MTDSRAWTLAVDFGTSNTAASISRAGGEPSAVRLSTQATTMPSGVLAEPSGLVVGLTAVRRARITPEAYEPHPKRRLGEDAVVLGEDEHAVVDLVAAVLADVRAKAVRVAGAPEPARVLLTHPQEWSAGRRRALVDAAARAGFDPTRVTLVSESVAAVQHYARSAPLPAGALVAVVDIGAGTCDTALLRYRPGDVQVLAAHGDPELGGLDIDDRLYRWLQEELRVTGRDALLAAVQASLGAQLTLREQVQFAKEELSEQPVATVRVAVDTGGSTGGPASATLTRAELSDLIAPEVERVVALVGRTLREGLPAGERLHTLYLTGGTSLVPAIHDALARATGVVPATLDDPKLVVASGAHHAVAEPPPAPPEPEPEPEPEREREPDRKPEREPEREPELEPDRKPEQARGRSAARRRGLLLGAGVAVVAVLAGAVVWMLPPSSGGELEDDGATPPPTSTPTSTTPTSSPRTSAPSPSRSRPSDVPDPIGEPAGVREPWSDPPLDTDGDGDFDAISRAYLEGTEFLYDLDADGYFDDRYLLDRGADGTAEAAVQNTNRFPGHLIQRNDDGDSEWDYEEEVDIATVIDREPYVVKLLGEQYHYTPDP